MTCCGPNSKLNKDEIVYRPDYRQKAVTEKFYSKYECLDMNDTTHLKNLNLFETGIEKRLRFDPRKYFKTPVTENQVYGWNEKLATRYDRLDHEILMHPKKNDETTAIMMKILYDTRKERMYGFMR